MKQAVNFRLSNRAINVLFLLEKKMCVSKTEIVEKALQSYAKKELSTNNNILEFAGSLDENEANKMLTVIESSKHNKKITLKL